MVTIAACNIEHQFRRWDLAARSKSVSFDARSMLVRCAVRMLLLLPTRESFQRWVAGYLCPHRPQAARDVLHAPCAVAGGELTGRSISLAANQLSKSFFSGNMRNHIRS